MNLENIKSVYFIGIGGSGMSAIANMMIAKGKNVYGSDKESSIITSELEQKGAHIFYEQNGTNFPQNVDLVLYTVAIPEDNPELVKAKEASLPLLSYPQILGSISKNMITIAVAGTHGKTTTTAMLAHILSETDIKPTVIVGSALTDKKTNFIMGKGEYLLVEADEYRKSFLNLNPRYLIITNIDEDHLDFYKDLEDVQDAFKDLVSKIPQDGFLICDKTHPHLRFIIENASCNVVGFRAFPKDAVLGVSGSHNRQNAGAALALASLLGVSDEVIFQKLETFQGVRRRFEYKGKTPQEALVYDDYAHNPQKVYAALQGAREIYPNQRIVVIFQPHLFSRTKTLLKIFGKSFAYADQVFLLPIYAAREEFNDTISSEMLAQEIRQNGTSAEAHRSMEVAKDFLDQILREGDIVVTMGAGDVTKLSEILVRQG